MQTFKVIISGQTFEIQRDSDGRFIMPEDLKRWTGMGSALKPSFEPIVLGMKPLDGTFAGNALKHGVAGLNIEGSRIAGAPRTTHRDGDHRQRLTSKGVKGGAWGNPDASLGDCDQLYAPRDGRWPANLILDEDSARLLDEASGELTSGSRANGQFEGMGFHGWKPVAMPAITGDSGGASRFFYIAKADSSERHFAGKNQHPTVKPIDLAAYLAKLLLPPERDTPRRLLVPYSGSGSEVIGALRAGWDHVDGIELESAYAEFSRTRIAADAPLLNIAAEGAG